MAPAPTTSTRICFPLLVEQANSEWRVANGLGRSQFAIRHSPFALLPLFAERADFHFEGPGAFWLLIELPIGSRNRGRRHQQIRIVERLLAPELRAPLAHPSRVHAG